MALTKHLVTLTLLGVLILPTFDSATGILEIPGFHLDQDPKLYKAKLHLNLETKTFEILNFEDNYCRFSPYQPVCEYQYETTD